MGQTYSLLGFLNATLRRSNKTVLVEGPTDKLVLHRLELEQFPEMAGASTIDHVGMINDPSLSGLGNRVKVQTVQQMADQLATSNPKITNVLATLTDREWDGVNFVAYVPSPAWVPPTHQPNRFITAGHSIENYHFDVECAVEFLKYAFPQHTTGVLLDEVKNMFPAILVFATVLSLKVRDASCITRSLGLIDPSHIEVRNNRVYLDPSFEVACASREIGIAPTIVKDTNSAIDATWGNLVGKDFTQWLPHGHLGDELIWSGIAKIAALRGIPQNVVKDIAHGRTRDREHFRAQWLSKLSAVRCSPLAQAIQWLHQ